MKKINNKIITLILFVIALIILCFKIYQIIEVNSKISEVENSSYLIDEQIKDKTKEVQKVREIIENKINPEYYINSIMSYGLLEDIKIETKINPSQFKDMVQLEIKFLPIKNEDKFKEFIVSLSLLGYIEDVKKGTILLNVKHMTNKEAKEVIRGEKGEN